MPACAAQVRTPVTACRARQPERSDQNIRIDPADAHFIDATRIETAAR
jgi:hypothetical protein